MSTMTIRGLYDSALTELKEKAKPEGKSVNAELVELLRDALGIKKRTVAYNDLDHLAGTWDKKDHADFQKRAANFEKIDDKMWK